jgi:hypothetical protein
MPSIEYVTLCDHAEVNNGKLNMIGGGWAMAARQVVTVLGSEPVPPPQVIPTRFAIAASIEYGWHEAGNVFTLDTAIVDQDELHPPVWRGQAQIMTGRPPGAPLGSGFRAILAFLVLVPFPTAGGYIVLTTVGGVSLPHKLPFHVVDQQVLGQAAPPQP